MLVVDSRKPDIGFVKEQLLYAFYLDLFWLNSALDFIINKVHLVIVIQFIRLP